MTGSLVYCFGTSIGPLHHLQNPQFQISVELMVRNKIVDATWMTRGCLHEQILGSLLGLPERVERRKVQRAGDTAFVVIEPEGLRIIEPHGAYFVTLGLKGKHKHYSQCSEGLENRCTHGRMKEVQCSDRRTKTCVHAGK